MNVAVLRLTNPEIELSIRGRGQEVLEPDGLPQIGSDTALKAPQDLISDRQLAAHEVVSASHVEVAQVLETGVAAIGEQRILRELWEAARHRARWS